MPMSYILSIDQGTTGTTIALIDTENYSVVDKVNNEFKQIFCNKYLRPQ